MAYWSSFTCITLSVSRMLSNGTITTSLRSASRITRSKPSGLTAMVTIASKPWLMKSSMAPSCAAASVPTETTLNSLMFSLIPAVSTKVLAVWIIWIRQVLPTKPLTRAIRYGPSFFDHWKYLVSADQGLKHWGS